MEVSSREENMQLAEKRPRDHDVIRLCADYVTFWTDLLQMLRKLLAIFFHIYVIYQNLNFWLQSAVAAVQMIRKIKVYNKKNYKHLTGWP